MADTAYRTKPNLKTLHAGGPFQNNGNPVLEWWINNVVGRYDARANVYPRKARREQKIDAAITAIMGIARCLAARPPGSRYNDPATRSPPFIPFPPSAIISDGRASQVFCELSARRDHTGASHRG